MIESRVRKLEESHMDLLSAKRTKKTFPGDDTFKLNETGIRRLESGQDADAEKFFMKALTHFEAGTVSCEGLNRLETQVVRNLSEKASCSKSKQSYIYQRQEYDEGMYAFTEALPLTSGQSDAAGSATLLYNIGQIHVRKGKYNEAKGWFELALTRIFQEAEVLTSSLILCIKIYHNIGHCFYRLGENLDALSCYQKALDAAMVIKAQDEIYTATSKNAIAVLLFHDESANKKEAMRYFQASLVSFLKCFGSKSKEMATVLNNIGRLHYLDGNYTEALSVYSEALKIRRDLLGSESIDVAASICNLGQTYHQLGQYEKAMSLYNTFLKFAENKFGPDHRDVAIIFRCVAELYHDQGQLDDAKLWYEKSLEVGRIAVGSNHPEVASTLNKLANLHYEKNELEAALQLYQEGLSIEQSVLQPYHPFIMVTLANIAQIYRQQEKYDEALMKYGQIQTIQLTLYGADSVEVANTMSSMALMHYHLKEYSCAFKLYKQAYCIQKQVFGNEENLDIASTLSSMGLVSFNRGFLDISMSYFSRSLQIRTRLLGGNHKDLAILWYNIATIKLEQGEDEEAIKIYNEALRIERNALGREHHDVILTLQHIGLVYQRRGELNEALDCFTEALDVLITKKQHSGIAVAKLLNLIGNIHLQSNNVEKMMNSYILASRIYREHNAEEALVIAGYSFYGLSKMHPPCAPLA